MPYKEVKTLPEILPKGKLQEVIEAKKRIVEGSLVIWNARLETLARAGHYGSVIDALADPVELGAEADNYGCDCGCPTTPDSKCECPPEDYGCGSGCGDFIADWLGKQINPAARTAAEKKE